MFPMLLKQIKKMKKKTIFIVGNFYMSCTPSANALYI